MDLKTIVRRQKTGLLFLSLLWLLPMPLRYDSAEEQYDKITATGGQVVLCSSLIRICWRVILPKEYPFWVIADPEQKIYKALSIDPAASIKDAIDEKGVEKKSRRPKSLA